MIDKHLLYTMITLSFTFSYVKNDAQASLDSIFKVAKWRNIGPHRGGRSVATAGVVNDPSTYYMGSTGGGLWKTDDMGISWYNISDGFFKTGSVGAVAVAPSDPNVVYVGMGEHAVRGVMTSHGDGVYKSTDAGKTWKKIGLDATQHIARIVVHPSNADIVYVAAQGSLYSGGNDRGIYKSMDGGASWKNVLYINDKTGCSELSMDASNPRILYAATWEYGRLPWKVISGGPGSALYKSMDSGETWQKLTDGLPTEMGKMSIAVAPSNSDKVYALIESDSNKETGGLFVSDNGGKSWSHVTNDHRLIQRAWYYIELYIDPKNDQVIYVLSATAYKSIDGGKSWEELSGTHGDYHDLWINPHNPKNMAIADDGGVAITFNGGKSWSAQDIYPTAQLYRINVDNDFPYHIYAGQQDNSSIKIPHRSFTSSISDKDWTSSAGGESAWIAFDPDNTNLAMGGSYQGTIELINDKAQAGTNIMSAPIQYLAMDAKDMKYRYNWNAPIIWSKHEKNTFYHGAQVLLKTQDYGKTWQEVSGDLTRNEKSKQGKGGGPYTNEAVGAENYGTLAYVKESNHEKGVIYTGSDDGLVHVTRDGGKTWKNVTPKDLKECLVNAIEVSPHDKATAYIATTRYKFNDHAPSLYKTHDYGNTWTKISNGIPANAFTRVVREDTEIKGLLFAGTELGVFISWNDGKTWQPFQLNLPTTPITDLKIHNDDLIVATSGRSFWIFDDLKMIRNMNILPTSFTVLPIESSYLTTGSSPLNKTDSSFKGMNSYSGVNPANGIVMYYYIPELVKDQELTLTIKDSNGKTIQNISSKKDSTYRKWDGGPSESLSLMLQNGLNRFVWDMRHATMIGVPDTYYENSFRGHKVPPGDYSLTFNYGKFTQTTKATILANPHYTSTSSDYQEYDAFMSEMENNVNEMQKMINDLNEKRRSIDATTTKLSSNPQHSSLKEEAMNLSKKMKSWDEDMVQRLSKAYDDVENFPNKFAANYMFVLNMTESDIPKVNQGSKDEKLKLDAQWKLLKERGLEINNLDLTKFNQKMCDAGLGGVW